MYWCTDVQKAKKGGALMMHSRKVMQTIWAKGTYYLLKQQLESGDWIIVLLQIFNS